MSNIKQYRKKPVVIEAWQLTQSNATNIANWINSNSKERTARAEIATVYIQTLEGEMKAEFQDYVIRGVNGEFYPCKPDIFHKTYEAVEEPTHE